MLELWRSLGGDWEQVGPMDGWAIAPGQKLWMPTEVKTPGPKENRFQAKQLSFIKRCELRGWPYWVWKVEADVLRCRGARRTA